MDCRMGRHTMRAVTRERDLGLVTRDDEAEEGPSKRVRFRPVSLTLLGTGLGLGGGEMQMISCDDEGVSGAMNSRDGVVGGQVGRWYVGAAANRYSFVCVG